MKTNYHTHHRLCGHAGGDVEDYVKEAIKNNYSILGISDHGPIDIHTFYRMNINEFKSIYLPQIEECQKKYPEIKILKALEIEYCYGYEDYYKELLKDLDYLILGTHYYSGYYHSNTNSSYGVDTLKKLESYTKLICDALDSKLFRILAHPDLFLLSYPQFDSDCERCAKMIIEAAIRNDVLIEFNCNGLKRGKREFENNSLDYAYPNKSFFDLVRQYNAKVIINRDCHSPMELDDEYTKLGRSLALEYGLRIVEEI